jgi:hypothetical protein
MVKQVKTGVKIHDISGLVHRFLIADLIKRNIFVRRRCLWAAKSVQWMDGQLHFKCDNTGGSGTAEVHPSPPQRPCRITHLRDDSYSPPSAREMPAHIPALPAICSRYMTSPTSHPALSFLRHGCLEGSLGFISFFFFLFLSEKKNVEKMVWLAFLSSQFTALW